MSDEQGFKRWDDEEEIDPKLAETLEEEEEDDDFDNPDPGDDDADDDDDEEAAGFDLSEGF